MIIRGFLCFFKFLLSLFCCSDNVAVEAPSLVCFSVTNTYIQLDMRKPKKIKKNIPLTTFIQSNTSVVFCTSV